MSNMNKPSQTYPLPPRATTSPMPVNIPDPSLKGVSFDQLLNNRGIRFQHKRFVPCPNIGRLADNSHNPNCPICDGNGGLYYETKEIYGVFYSNSLEKNFEQQGVWEIGTAIVTLSAEYADGTQAEFNMFDQLVIPDFTVRLWEMKEYEVRTGLAQKLRYPIVNTDFVGSAVDDALVTYVEGTAFNITAGDIVWVSGNEPAVNDVVVYSYYANPVYQVLQNMRELRITQELISGSKTARRLPMQVLVKRDFLVNPPETEA